MARHAEQFVILSRSRPYRGRLGDVLDRARRFAAGLIANGVRPGDAVLFQTPNWIEGVIALYGAVLAGCVVVPIPFFYGVKETRFILRQAKPRVFVTVDRFGFFDYLAALEQLWPDLDGIDVFVAAERVPASVRSFSSLADHDAVDGTPEYDPAGATLLAYTAGTTADPKGVVHSHRSIVAEVRQLSEAEPPGPPRINAAPIGHAIGMLGALLVPVVRGSATYLVDVWDPAWILETMVAEQITAGSGAPFFAAVAS